MPNPPTLMIEHYCVPVPRMDKHAEAATTF